MSELPLGIADLQFHGLKPALKIQRVLDSAWYYCRRHEQAHKVGEQCQCTCGGLGDPQESGHVTSCPRHLNLPCIDVGPFMSEREALYCMGHEAFQSPLGMAVES